MRGVHTLCTRHLRMDVGMYLKVALNIKRLNIDIFLNDYFLGLNSQLGLASVDAACLKLVWLLQYAMALVHKPAFIINKIEMFQYQQCTKGSV